MARVHDLAFTKSWENASDFPTYEDSEAQVRADLQLLFDEIRNFLNTQLLPAVNVIRALDVTCADNQDLQTALNALSTRIEAVRDETIDTELGQLIDGSLTAAKFAPGEAAGWEDVTGAVTLAAEAADGAVVTSLTLQNKSFQYSRALGVMTYWLQLGVVTTAPAELRLYQQNYHAPRANIAGRAGSVYARNTNTALPQLTSAAGAAMCRRLPEGSNDATEYVVQLFSARSGQVFVSGWYFCEGA